MTRASDTSPMDLTAKLLIAMPGMADSRFEHSVVLICAHSPEGAMGLIVNKRFDDLRLSELVEQLEIGDGSCVRDRAVHFGGPVEPGRGFVLHTRDFTSDLSTLEVGEEFGMTATLDILEALAAGEGPMRALMALGYAGWGPEQLEGEILANGWLTCDADLSLVFDTLDDGKWEAALKSLGVDAISLSAAAGRA
ncbi:YqgE/AlgH family protein [Alisedimentitalea sp. MJ-SS2]|uniref:YqgE/AlgH family protein n=1 Tax=Aliisedimentitalea sp. MJ-SS2 TaxID=3049795 RepID=UPI00290B80AE|nr:YqgE/AlgH family protein [Alisedimentitalea sp. MJ-SS2]MDU8928248.1 YqgE/AlgH family protein [Alisedimentitalea sp. MJ-SS2]